MSSIALPTVRPTARPTAFATTIPSPYVPQTNIYGFNTQEYGQHPGPVGLGINSGLDQGPPFLLDPRFNYLSGGGNSTATQHNMQPDNNIHGFGPSSHEPHFNTRTPSALATEDQYAAGGSGGPTYSQSPNEVGNSFFDNSTQFNDSAQDVEGMQPIFNPSLQPSRPVFDGRTSYGHWQNDGQSGNPLADSDAPNPQSSNGSHNTSSGPLGQDIGDMQGVDAQQPSSQGGQHQTTATNMPPANQQGGESSERTPRAPGDRRRPIDTPSPEIPATGYEFSALGAETLQDYRDRIARESGVTEDPARGHPGAPFEWPSGQSGGVQHTAFDPTQYRPLAPGLPPSDQPAKQQHRKGRPKQGGVSSPPNLRPRQKPTPQGRSRHSQSSSPPARSDPAFQSRLNPSTTAVANVGPANLFLRSIGSMHLLDQLANFDVLMQSEHAQDFIKPLLTAEYDKGHSKGIKNKAMFSLTGAMIEDAQFAQVKHDIKQKRTRQDLKIESERRRRERGGTSSGSGIMMSGASEIYGMPPVSGKRHASGPPHDDRYVFGGYQSNGEDSEDDIVVPRRGSPKKHRTSGPPMPSGPTPAELVNKFCSETNIRNQNPFFDDEIHTQLRKLPTEQLICVSDQWVAQNGNIADTNVEHWRACAGQAAGMELDADKACKHCAEHIEDGSVPFETCVVLDDRTEIGQQLNGACMNCIYLGIEQECGLALLERESKKVEEDEAIEEGEKVEEDEDIEEGEKVEKVEENDIEEGEEVEEERE